MRKGSDPRPPSGEVTVNGGSYSDDDTSGNTKQTEGSLKKPNYLKEERGKLIRVNISYKISIGSFYELFHRKNFVFDDRSNFNRR